jgi:Domain of unknown function (DUF3560)
MSTSSNVESDRIDPDTGSWPLQGTPATYSPDDNKLRLHGTSVPPVLYTRLREAGFIRAPRQQLFVAPAWKPEREDLLLELCGCIGDEDTSLLERATARATRFEEYSESRALDAQAARERAAASADARRIHHATRNSVQLWDTAHYWAARAQAAVGHAQYKQRPDVRRRRIKTLEADKRKQERRVAHAQRLLVKLQPEGLSTTELLAILTLGDVSQCFPLSKYPRQPPASQYEGPRSLWSTLNDDIINAAQARQIAIRSHQHAATDAGRWLTHTNSRIAYERAMLGESVSTIAEEVKPEGAGAS